ncbi:pentatricopeptide repeat-containing protein [Pyrus ussuriensis x Pyrus communis]|uniref:Pentatricopeptide repeat-containing protein n=1 Tax=Pyrus ussuriensis x Pyrus communis TaxID=2448454 RepID=A0A5N5FTW2_9ROSA|nr:pentatricopeptide repeat-containing protein [Pyrus ussuriensis x Pyrus communis]
MNLRHLISRQAVNNASKVSGTLRSLHAFTTIAADPVPHYFRPPGYGGSKPLKNPNFPKPISPFHRYIHSAQAQAQAVDSEDSEQEEDGAVRDFLSRFVWIMRQKLSESYPGSDKATVDGMLLIVVERVVAEMEKGGIEQMLGSSQYTDDFSEDLWRTVWEVSNMVLEDMRRETKKEKMKGFLQEEEVKEMCRFAGEVGIRGDMLRELRFKWAQEKMEETEFYQSLERLREGDKKTEEAEGMQGEAKGEEVESKVVSLPKRRGKIKYNIYGLDLSDPKWVDVADRIHEAEEITWPQEPKSISGKCKLVTEKIIQTNVADDQSPLLAEWIELLQPSRVDWLNLLDRLKEQNTALYFKVAELVLDEKSFQTNIRDYSILIDAHAKENHLEDAERILKKMNENGIVPDILTTTSLVHMYSKVGNLDGAKQAFESLRSQGFKPDVKVYNLMIMAYVNAGQPKFGESLMREMEARDIKPTKEIFMTLLRSFAQQGDIGGAGRIANIMQFAGSQPTLESCTLLVEAYGKAGDPDQARSNFDYMMKVGHRPDDRCTASMLAAYEKKNLLDKALNLLTQLEKDGFEPGVATYSVLIDWLGKLQLVGEAEQLLGKIAEQGEAPPLKVHIGLFDMYAKAGVEKKALQALGVLEAKKDQLGSEEFERIINGLIAGGFVQDAHRVRGLMEAQGFAPSEPLKMALMASQAFGRKRPSMRR